MKSRTRVPSRRAAAGRSGFTLIEVVAAVATMATALLYVLAIRNRNLGRAQDAKNLWIACQLAKQKMSEMELMGYPDEISDSGAYEDGKGLSWSVEVSTRSDEELGGELRHVKVVVKYRRTGDEGEEVFEGDESQFGTVELVTLLAPGTPSAMAEAPAPDDTGASGHE